MNLKIIFGSKAERLNECKISIAEQKKKLQKNQLNINARNYIILELMKSSELLTISENNIHTIIAWLSTEEIFNNISFINGKINEAYNEVLNMEGEDIDKNYEFLNYYADEWTYSDALVGEYQDAGTFGTSTGINLNNLYEFVVDRFVAENRTLINNDDKMEDINTLIKLFISILNLKNNSSLMEIIISQNTKLKEIEEENARIQEEINRINKEMADITGVEVDDMDISDYGAKMLISKIRKTYNSVQETLQTIIEKWYDNYEDNNIIDNITSVDKDAYPVNINLVFNYDTETNRLVISSNVTNIINKIQIEFSNDKVKEYNYNEYTKRLPLCSLVLEKFVNKDDIKENNLIGTFSTDEEFDQAYENYMNSYDVDGNNIILNTGTAKVIIIGKIVYQQYSFYYEKNITLAQDIFLQYEILNNNHQ